MHLKNLTVECWLCWTEKQCSVFLYTSQSISTLSSAIATDFKRGMLACGQHVPGFLKLFWFACQYVCVCVSALKVINDQ